MGEPSVSGAAGRRVTKLVAQRHGIGRGAQAHLPARVLVVIVNFRTSALVVNCLRALEREVRDRVGTQAVVVDNCSGDGSADAIAAAIDAAGWGGWASVHRAPVNGGFSYGNNCAIRASLNGGDPPDYFWLLNSDTEPRLHAMASLLDFLEHRPAVGIAGSSLEMADGTVWPHAFRFPSVWSELASGLRLGIVARWLKGREVLLRMGDSAERVDWLPGASMMIRRTVFESVGLMDEDYFLYFEETDFCLKAARANWECWYVPQSRVMHITGQSTGVTGQQAGLNRRPKYWFESRRRYWIKNHGWFYAAATDLVWMLAFSIRLLRNFVQRKPDPEPPQFLRDFLVNSALFHLCLPRNSAISAGTTDAK